MESTYSLRQWHSGHPPHIGWWQASLGGQRRDMWRWWDGQFWSKQCTSQLPAQAAAINMQRHEEMNYQRTILWNDYWPDDGRCVRVDPRTGRITGELRITPPEFIERDIKRYTAPWGRR